MPLLGSVKGVSANEVCTIVLRERSEHVKLCRVTIAIYIILLRAYTVTYMNTENNCDTNDLELMKDIEMGSTNKCT